MGASPKSVLRCLLRIAASALMFVADLMQGIAATLLCAGMSGLLRLAGDKLAADADAPKRSPRGSFY